MKCRHCGNELPEGITKCPNCEKSNIKPWQMIVAIVAAVVVLASLAIVLFFGMDLDFLKKDKKKVDDTTVPVLEETIPKYESDVDYTGTDDDVTAASDTVVATLNGNTLTNRELQFYYNNEVYNFVSYYSSYLTDMGLDYTKPLNEQKCYYKDLSWEAYFVEEAIATWRQYQVVYALAKEDGFALSEESAAVLETLPEDLAEAAKQYGYEDVASWLKDYMLAGVTVEDYVEYSTLVAYYTEYIMQEPSATELEQYYEDNADYFKENKVDKDAGPMVDVRHILVQPTGGTTDENNVTVYSDEEWAACLEETEKIYNEWKSGDATEATFAELANKYSTDGGSNTNGGLYSGVTSTTNFVEPFLNWSIDESRRVGDTEIVKTEFGYHIMYFSAGQQVWEYYAKEWYASDREIELVETGVEKWPIEIDYDVICIGEFVFQ